MEILQLLFANFGKTLLITMWVVCGIIAIIRGKDALYAPFFMTLLYGIYRLFTH